ncbi:ubiquitin carboxyl-terminal hydrolase-related protein [Actinidia rufa]|uniref:Ubiquitin carboxyl-terminal hydrolase-related protein n=1 Tax=Actinidia rufa TaxID=165716 RepID=A0A7J0FY86_9ERIC|nr:ubiquitin carboxyl-terminal hydrolase-related protein [Actinidia rufa]
MGNKKRNVAPRSKSAPSVPGGDAGSAYDGVANSIEAEQNLNPNSSIEQRRQQRSKIEASDASSYSAIKLECERALTALRRGNHTKALRLMKEMSAKHENSAHSALIHRRHLKNAIESARKAVLLSPNSVEFAHFYANLLYEAANDGKKEYEEVVQECERGLAIENPIDPAEERLQDESQQKMLTADARIGHVQNEIRLLIQNSNISIWMKNLGQGEEKFRLIPLRRVSEDPMEVRLIQTRRPNEIKKATKTPEERRKEIEVRVAAARLLQQKSESSQSQNDDNNALASSSGSAQRVGERRKSGNTRKIASSAERRDRVKSYWNFVSLDMQKDLLRIMISELKAHFSSAKDSLANEVISEAISFAESNRTWKFWMCYCCSERIADSESHMQHVLQEHMENLLPKMQSILPQNVDNEWIDMLLNCPELVDESSPQNNKEEFKDSLTDSYFSEDVWNLSSESSSEKGKLGDSCNGDTAECKSYGKVSDIQWQKFDGNQGDKEYFLPDSWPLSDDTERAKLLEKNPCHIPVDELQGLASGSQLLNYGRSSEKIIPVDDSNTGTQGSEITEKIILTEDASCLFFDEQLLPFGLNSTPCHDAATGDAAGPTSSSSSSVGFGNQVLFDVDALLSWMFTGPTTGEQLALWTRMREEKAQEGMEICETLKKEFYHLQSMYERKCERLSYEEAVQAVEDLCLEEGKKREHVTEFVSRSYESVLRKRREELIESDSDVMFISNRFELNAISNILKEAENLNVNQFGFEETYSGATSHLCDLELGDDDDWRTKDYLHQVDSCIEVAIQRQKEQLATELSELDARMMRSLTGMQQLEVKLELVSAHDYQSILVPLVKSFVRARLEDLAEKDATEKSDAAREAFLAELALDTRKGSGGATDNSKHAHEKTKDKKKNKEHRKTKDSKDQGIIISYLLQATGNNELMVYHEAAEGISSPVASNGDHPDSEIAVSVYGDASKLEEEEIRRKIELEAEERKLEETLEYQRRIEDEAKQKYLAEQHKKAKRTIPEKYSDDDQDVYKQLKHCKQDPLTQKNGFPNGLEGVPVNTTDKAAQRIGNTAAHNHTKVQQGLPNDIPEDGILSNDRRTGRKGRRQKSSAKLLETNYQTSEKENIEVGQVRVQDGLHGEFC